MKHYMYQFCNDYNMIYLFYVQIIKVCPSYGSGIAHYNNQSSGCEEKLRQPPIMPTTQNQISRAYKICRQYFIRYLGLLDATINSVN